MVLHLHLHKVNFLFYNDFQSLRVWRTISISSLASILFVKSELLCKTNCVLVIILNPFLPQVLTEVWFTVINNPQCYKQRITYGGLLITSEIYCI